MWVRMAKIAAEKLPQASGTEAEFYAAKLATAQFFIDRLLPPAGALLYTIKAGKAPIMALAEPAF
jgi:hypothetical protein